MIRDTSLPKGPSGKRKAKSKMNSSREWRMAARLAYWPRATASSTLISTFLASVFSSIVPPVIGCRLHSGGIGAENQDARGHLKKIGEMAKKSLYKASRGAIMIVAFLRGLEKAPTFLVPIINPPFADNSPHFSSPGGDWYIKYLSDRPTGEVSAPR